MSIRNKEFPDTRCEPTTVFIRDVLALVREHSMERSVLHIVKHTEDTVRRTDILTSAMGLSLRERQIARIAAVGHHLEVIGSLREGPFGKEYAIEAEPSAAASFVGLSMHIADRNADLCVTGEELECIQQAILASARAWNGLDVLAQNESFVPGCHPIVRAVVLADVGCPGMDGPRALHREVTAMLKDQYPDRYRETSEHGLRSWFELVRRSVYRRELLLSRSVLGLPAPVVCAVRRACGRYMLTYRYLERVGQQGSLRDWFN